MICYSIATYWYVFLPFSVIVTISTVYLIISNAKKYLKLKRLSNKTWEKARFETNRLEEIIQQQLKTVGQPALV